MNVKFPQLHSLVLPSEFIRFSRNFSHELSASFYLDELTLSLSSELSFLIHAFLHVSPSSSCFTSETRPKLCRCEVDSHKYTSGTGPASRLPCFLLRLFHRLVWRPQEPDSRLSCYPPVLLFFQWFRRNRRVRIIPLWRTRKNCPSISSLGNQDRFKAISDTGIVFLSDEDGCGGVVIHTSTDTVFAWPMLMVQQLIGNVFRGMMRGFLGRFDAQLEPFRPIFLEGVLSCAVHRLALVWLQKGSSPPLLHFGSASFSKV